MVFSLPKICLTFPGTEGFACKQAWAPDYKVIRLLVKDVKIPLDKKNNDGDTPLHCAARQGHIKIAKYLLQQGANPNVTNNINETPQTLMLQALLSCEKEDWSIMELFSQFSERLPRFAISYEEIFYMKLQQEHKQGLWIRCFSSSQIETEVKNLSMRENLSEENLREVDTFKKTKNYTLFSPSTFIVRNIPIRIFRSRSRIGVILKAAPQRKIPYWYDGQQREQLTSESSFWVNKIYYWPLRPFLHNFLFGIFRIFLI